MEKGVPIRTVSRSLQVLKLMNRNDSMSLMEISKAIHLPYPTTFRIVQTLIHEGFMECENTRKRYRVTRQVQSLSSGYNERGNLIKVARPFIVELTLRFGWPVTVSTGVGEAVIIRDSTYAMSSLALNHYYPGYTFPLLECAAGLVHVAWLGEAERGELLDHLQEDAGDSEMLARCRDADWAAAIRSQGFVSHQRSQCTANPGRTSSLSAPILMEGFEQGQLTLSYLADDLSVEQAIQTCAGPLQDCAWDIAQALGEARA